jgi:hypothetical protein
MSRRTSGGVPFHGEINTSDATNKVAFDLYNAARTALTVGSNDSVTIESYSIVVNATGTSVSLLSGSTGAGGSVLRSGNFAAKNGMAGSQCELLLKKGDVPNLSSADAVAIVAQIEGRIYRG